MTRYSSGRWFLPATGRQIAALKAHCNYVGKYYSIGRASQAIGRRTASGSGRSPRRYPSPSYSAPTPSSASSLSWLFAGPLGVPDIMKSRLAQALQYAPLTTGSESNPVQSVAFTVAPDETDLGELRIQFGTTVTRDSSFAVDAKISVQFTSNIELGRVPPTPPAEFQSGVEFSE